MSKHIYQKINWKNYNKFWEKNFTKSILEIKKYFENKNDKYKELNLVFYKSYFFFSVSQIIFFDYLEKKRFFKHYEKKTFKSLLYKLFNKRVIEYKFLKKKKLNYQNKIINFKFFFRHFEFEKKFTKLKNFKNIKFENYTKTRFKKIDYNSYDKFSFKISSDLISEIYTLEVNFDKFFKSKYPKILMTSSHAYANDILSRLFISFSKTLKTKIFVYQTNFLQGIIDFYDFNKYEDIISDKYFSTGKNLNIKKYTILGSLYSYKYKLNNSNKIDKNLIILNQPPDRLRNFPKQLSMDWANTYDEFVSNENDMLSNIKKIYLDNKDCHFLSKDICYDYYLKKFKQHSINSKLLRKSYVNNSKKINNYNYKNIFITYPSNAMVEYYYAGSKIFLKFPKNFIFLKNLVLKKNFFSDKKISTIIKTYAKETNPTKVFKILSKYF